MNRYLILFTYDELGYQYTVERNSWQEALVAMYEYKDCGSISAKDFSTLIKDKDSKEALELFDKLCFRDGSISFFGVINKPFISNFTDIDVKRE